MDRLRVLLLAYTLDGTDVGETWSGFKMAETLSASLDVTVLCLQRPGRQPTREQLPLAEVVTWPEPAFLSRFERIRAQIKPAWPLLSWHVREWLKRQLKAGRRFHVAHQILPQAMRHASPFRSFDIPYVVGPLGGGLSTPVSFAHEIERESILSRLRDLDQLRLRIDRGLRKTYTNAEVILGVAPYVRDALHALPIRHFESFLERAGEAPAQLSVRNTEAGSLKLLHVGRAIRTKGLRDVIRALALLRDMPRVTLTSAGDGPDLEQCRREAFQLGVSDKVTFLGKVDRATVESLYASHDVFAFPSFREPMGGVVFEAIRWGLPVVAANRGGPAVILDDSCSVMIDVTTPDQFPQDIASAIRRLALETAFRKRLSEGTYSRAESIGSWADKAAKLEELYRFAIAAAESRRAGR